MPYKRGHRVFGLVHLRYATLGRQSVYVPKSPAWRKPRPAAFMIHLPGAVLVKLFDLGMYIYQPIKEATK
jgi:hypothetical protein